MKWICLLCTSALLGVANLRAQPGQVDGTSMTAGPPGPGLSGSTAKLFGQNNSFSAQLDMPTAAGQGTDAMSIPGKIFFDAGDTPRLVDLVSGSTTPMFPQGSVARLP